MHIHEEQQYIRFQGPDPINNGIPPAALKARQYEKICENGKKGTLKQNSTHIARHQRKIKVSK